MPSLTSYFLRFAIRTGTAHMIKPGESVQDLRAKTEKATRLAKTPAGLNITPVMADGVPAEWEFPDGLPDDRAILYIHGGAWIICSPRTHRNLVGQLARIAGVKALSIDYRLAPEHPFPAALEDCLAAYHWLLSGGITAQKIVIAGDSAGGNLTLATLLALRDAGDELPAAAVCFSPATDLAGTGESRRTRAKVELLLGSFTNVGDVTRYYIGNRDPREPLISPLYGDLHGLPPILIHVGDDEILLDDSTRFVERACAAGVEARVVVWPGMWHVFQANAPTLPEARQSLQAAGAFIREKIGS